MLYIFITRGTEALDDLIHTAKKNSPVAQYNLAEKYYHRFISKKSPDFSKAVSWFKKAILSKYQIAKIMLRAIYISRDCRIDMHYDALQPLYWFEQHDTLRTLFHEQNKPIEKDFYKKTFTKMAEHSYLPDAQNALGIMYRDSKILIHYDGTVEHAKGDKYSALYWFAQAATNGNTQALYNLAMMLEDFLKTTIHTQTTDNIPETFRQQLPKFLQNVHNIDTMIYILCEKAADIGNPFAQFTLAIMYRDGTYGVKQDEEKYIYYLTLASDAGHNDAIYTLGIHYLDGTCGFEQNTPEALSCIGLAAFSENSDAQYKLAKMYYHGHKGMPKSRSQSLLWLISAADLRDARAQFRLSMLYLEGIDGVTKNIQTGIGLLTLSANTEFAKAQYKLGIFHRDGLYGLTTNIDKAIKLLRASTYQGYCVAEYILGVMFRDAIYGVTHDIDQGFKLIKSSADKGYAEAQYALGLMYHLGIGGLQIDNALSKKYLELAEKQGNISATNKIQKFFGIETVTTNSDVQQNSTDSNVSSVTCTIL